MLSTYSYQADLGYFPELLCSKVSPLLTAHHYYCSNFRPALGNHYGISLTICIHHGFLQEGRKQLMLTSGEPPQRRHLQVTRLGSTIHSTSPLLLTQVEARPGLLAPPPHPPCSTLSISAQGRVRQGNGQGRFSRGSRHNC